MEEGNIVVTIEPFPSIPDLQLITVIGSLDTVTAQYADEKILPVIEREKSNVILDLSNINYLSSVGLLRLIKYLTSMTDQGRVFKLVTPPKHIYGIFIAGIASRFDMYDNLEAAIRSL